jgi:hypothetical protein
VACHNEAAVTLSSVVFPSGVEVTGLASEARCMTCHQGRESKVSVDATIDGAGLADPNVQDTASTDLSFRNIHYKAAAATLYGGITKGGYEYDGKSYDIKFAHVQGIDTCIDCHDQHSLEVRVEVCATCHPGVQTSEDLRNIRMLCTTCHDAMPEFTRRQVKTVAFPSGATLDTGNPNSNLCINCHQGRKSTVSVNTRTAGLDPDTVSSTLSFANVHYLPAGATLFGTAAKGAYEYEGKTYVGRFIHVSSFDICTECHDAHTLEVDTTPCAHVHNGKYIIQVLHDSIADLATQVPVDMSKMVRP